MEIDLVFDAHADIDYWKQSSSELISIRVTPHASTRNLLQWIASRSESQILNSLHPLPAKNFECLQSHLTQKEGSAHTENHINTYFSASSLVSALDTVLYLNQNLSEDFVTLFLVCLVRYFDQHLRDCALSNAYRVCKQCPQKGVWVKRRIMQMLTLL